MLFSHKVKKLLAVFGILIWAHIDGCMAFAAYQTASFKLAPRTYSETPPAAADNGAALLFDRSTETSFAPSAPALVDISLDKAQVINELRIYGSSSCVLTVQGQINGQWQDIAPLKNLALGGLSSQWHRYPFKKPLETKTIRLQLLPVADAGEGIREIELWSPGQQEPVSVSGQALLDQGVATGQGRRYQALPKAGVIGLQPDGAPDSDSDNVFRFNLAYRPAQIRRAYLSYDLAGLAHWTGAIRSVNEQAAMGGQLVERGKGGRQIEEISPAWLRQGANQIRFTPLSEQETYRVSNVQVLIELDNGTNLVSRVSSNMGQTAAEAARLYDGSTSTGLPLKQKRNELITGWESPLWQQPAETEEPEGAAAELEFNRLTDLTSVGFYAAGIFKGNIRVFLKKQSEWTESSAGGEISFSKAGWYWLGVQDGAETTAVRLLFEQTEGNAALREVRAAGSSLGTGDTPLINVSYPEAGQYFGDKIYLRGFAPADNGSGPVQLFVGNYALPHVNGEFEAVADAALAANGTIELMARYPDGTSAVSLIPLRQDLLRQKNRLIELRGSGRETTSASDDNKRDSAAQSGAAPAAAVSSDVSLTEEFQVTGSKDWTLKFKNGAQIDIGRGSVRNAVKIRMMTLRDRDLPGLDAGMINVTGRHKGFRLLPHGMKFDKKIKVKLPYGKQLIPPGFSEDDVRTYFFDDASGRWTVLDRDSVDKASSGIVSSTDHFTDMINAVVQAPESPDKVSFSPTQIKDIKIAPPHAKINLIEPPQADSQGDARLSYPLEVPPGRKGMQPQLAVQYSSGGGSGWMGLGWDLPTQAVSIDTRWGVPRYDAAKETETYTLNGQQLTPLAHRGALADRSPEKVFHARTEGAFQKIIRHGSNPANYWWEVIDKNGTHFFYGGDPAAGLTDDAVLKDYAGNVAKWALRTVRDSNGNTMRYQYARQQDSGIGGGAGGVPGDELYLDKIFYTGHRTEQGIYEVRFLRDRQLGEARRADVSIDARLGFKKVDADLLRKIEVRCKGQLVRAYAFSYRTGAFAKTLLERIIQFDKDGKEFNRHQFAYYDEARNANGYLGFGAAEMWDTGDDNVDAPMLFGGDASAIGGTSGWNVGGHLYVGVGLGPKKDVSIGGKVGGSHSSSKGLLALSDVNGDGLPDKVFGAGHQFRPNLSGPQGGTRFGEAASIGLSDISREKSNMISAGAEAYAGATVGLNVSNTFSETTAYLSDVNGDGLTDLVSGGSVTFGRPDNPEAARPVPLYSGDSSQTPNPVGSGAVDGQNLLENMEELYQEMLAAAPLHDTLRRWTAPYAGRISISGDAALIKDSSEERQAYATADGVRVAIQHNSGELWAKSIEPTDYAPKTPQGVNAIQVSKGDRIYFRVQSRFDGAYDQVSWNPEIRYLNVSATPDANGLDPYSYQAGADFIPTGRTGLTVTLPATGTAALSGTAEITAPCSDDITVKVLLNNAEQFSQKAAAGQTASIPLNLSLNVAKEDQLQLKIETDSPVDAAKVRWQPHLEYTAIEGRADAHDSQGKAVLAFDPPYVMDIYGDNDLNAPLQRWTAPKAGTVTVNATAAGSASGILMLTAKKDSKLVGKAALDLSKGSTIAIPLAVAQGDKLNFELNSRNRELAKKISSYSITSQYGSESAVAVPSALNFPAEEGFFGQPYRGWTYAGYKGEGDKAGKPIAEADLKVPEFDQARFDRDKQTENPEELDPQFSPEKLQGIMFYPEPAQDRWRGNDDGTWVKAAVQSSSRLNTDYVSVPKAEQYAGARAVSRLSRSKQIGVFAGGGPASGSYTFGASKSLLDFMDMNGDRFPDVVSSGGIQYSPMTGGLEGGSRPVLSGLRQTDTKAWSFGLGGNFAQIKFGGKGKQKDGGIQMPPLGISGNFGKAGDEAAYDLLDINGDGLPDKVYDSGSAALNLGYSFAAPEPWGSVKISEGDSLNLSGGLSAGFNDGVYGFGGGVNVSRSEHKTKGALLDINGDGLPDYVRQGGNVLLNTGGGFTAMQYPGASGFSENASTDQGGGFYFTISIPLPPTPICIIINPGADAGMSMGRPEIAVMDIDGDGFPDHLTSTKDSSIEVRRNQIGRTNLLKKVSRPLGASFTLDYERDGNTYQLPQSRWNLSRVAVFDGFAGDGADTLVTTFKYEDGFQHRQEREFFGYKTVTTEQRKAADNSVYRSTVQTFLNRNYYEKGLLVSEIVQDGEGGKYLETLNSYQLRDVGSGRLLEGAFKDSLTATVFPELIRTDKKFYEGQAQPGISTWQTFEYDALGNVTHFFDSADAGADDDVESFIGYHRDLASYIVGKANKIEVKSNGKLLRQREAVFENGTGNLRQVRLSFGSGTAVHDLDYDKYGNIVKRTGPANKKGQRYSLSYAYDPDARTYVTAVKDSFGYSSSAAYDLKWGEITSSTDLNKQAITYRHDSVGRVLGITGPYQQSTGRETIVFAYHPEAAVPWALTRHFDNYQQKTDPLETVLFVDGLKRELQTKKDGAVSTGEANSKDVMLVSGRVIFDFAGRVIEQYYPVAENLGSQGRFNPAFDSVPPTKTKHDVLDRVLLTTLPDSTSTSFAYDFGQDRDGATRFETKVTDAKKNAKVTYKDVGEAITSVKEFNQGKTLWTSYQYDPLNQITEVKDAKGNLTKVGYDLMGRRTAINSPDAGLTEYVYDPASNLVKKITANLRATGKAIEYDYTYNRLDGIRYPDYPGNNVSYSYGAPGAAFNRADRIVKVTDGSGSEERFYGPLGETVKTIRYVASKTEGNGPSSPEVYVSEYTYDTYNRLRRLIWPDGEVLTYSYNSGGLPQSASGSKGTYSYPYLKALTYDKFEQRVFLRQGNGAETKYSYNPLNRRLAGLQAKAAGRQFMDLAYQYDPVGNILGLDNLAAVSKPNQFGGRLAQTFGYDDLYRLTSAAGSLKQQPNTEHRYALAMQYDEIHNIVGKNQKHVRITPGDGSIVQRKTTYDFQYAYAGPQPHAPTQIGDRAFSYDANGNQTGWDSTANGTRRRIGWDEENRVRQIEDNGHTMRYTYNDAGERVFKTGPQGETAYVSQFYSVRNREVGSKHIFIGTGRIATKMVKGQENAASGKGNGKGNIVYEKDIYYYHPDHLGSSTFISAADGELYQHLENFPFGETWVEESSSTQRTPYHFTAKELDEETGLYYFGARYYDPRTSVWQSTDPILDKYMPFDDADDLPGIGGVFNTYNLNIYHYSAQNPVKYTDPDGKVIETAWDVANLVMDVASLGANIASGNYGAAAVDAAGLIVDGLATVVPGVPGGAGTAIKAVRAADKTVDAVKAIKKADKVADAAKTTTKAASKIDRKAFKAEREAFWKAETKNNSGKKYSADNLARMKKGRAPIGADGHPMELHHVDRTQKGGLTPMTRTDHRLGENYKKNHPD